MDQFKKAFQDLGLVTFLHDREYLWASAFPSDTENRCPASLLKKHILYIGENTERVKLMLESIIDDYTAGNCTVIKVAQHDNNLIRSIIFFR